MNGKKIKQLRKYLDLSLISFGKPLGYSGTRISFFEKNEVPDSVIDTICKIYKVNPSFFYESMPLETAVLKQDTIKDAGQRIKQTRLEKKLTMQELSDLSGISRPQICNIENGVFSLTEKTAIKIAEALEVGVEWLLYGNMDKKDFPLDEKLKNWLWNHPEIRKELWKKMKQDL